MSTKEVARTIGWLLPAVVVGLTALARLAAGTPREEPAPARRSATSPEVRPLSPGIARAGVDTLDMQLD